MYGPVAPASLPKQDAEKVRIIADRWWRANQGHEQWATAAKECVDSVEGRQWTEQQKLKLAQEGRPILTFNKTAPLVRLTTGYMRNNRTDIRYRASNDGQSTPQVAEAHTKIFKVSSEANQLPWIEADTFLDGLVTGRGFVDIRLDFEQNDLGEIKITCKDPFSIFLDPDAESYDLNDHAFVAETRWLSLDAIESCYGIAAAKSVRPFVGTSGQSWGGFPFIEAGGPEITPIRTFGQTDDPTNQWFRDFFHTELIDRYRKTVRVIDMQHRITTWGPCFIDLETGDKIPVPQFWNRNQIEKALYHAQQIGNPLIVQNRPYKRVRWTVLVGDLMVHDDWSPYPNYTITGFFPYFRRGMTRGMVHDLLDPQREINKRRSAELEIVSRTANSGWLLNRDSLSAEEETNFIRNGSKPGFTGMYRGDPTKKPERINPAPPPMAMERLEQRAADDLREISGINESALGELDRVQSGRAIEARQRQAVIAIQMYMDNFSRTKDLLGRRHLEIVQRHYTEERMFRVTGEGGNEETLMVNQPVIDPMTGQPTGVKMNDLTIGRYAVSIDETPLSPDFKAAQFDEMMEILKQLGPVGQAFMQIRPDLVMDMSTLPRKDEWSAALRQAIGAAPPPGTPGAPPGAPPPGGGPQIPGPPAPGGAPTIAGGQNVIPLQPPQRIPG